MNNLSITKFAASNYMNKLIRVALFFADCEFYSQTNIQPLEIYSNSKKRAEFFIANKIVKKQNKSWVITIAIKIIEIYIMIEAICLVFNFQEMIRIVFENKTFAFHYW